MEEKRALLYHWHWVGERNIRGNRKGKRVLRRSMVICPKHQTQFFYLHPNAREYGEYFDPSECEYCIREKSASQQKHYTEEELKGKVEELVSVIWKHSRNRIDLDTYKMYFVRAVIRYYSKIGFRMISKVGFRKISKVGFRKVSTVGSLDVPMQAKPEKLDILLNEWLERNENARSLLSQAYEIGVLDDIYKRTHVIHILDELNKIMNVPARINSLRQRNSEKHKRSRRIEA